MPKRIFQIIMLMLISGAISAQAERLTVLQADTIATGIVTAVHNEKDGDLHIWMLMPDGTKLLAEVEHYSTSGYRRPHSGDKVTFKGPFVYDRHHAWYEVHPATPH